MECVAQGNIMARRDVLWTYIIQVFMRFPFIFSGLIFVFSVCVGLLTSCRQDEPAPPEVPSGRRTVLVYMVADNNLGSADFDSYDLAEMLAGVKAGALGEGDRLLVFHEPYGTAPSLKEVTPSGVVTLASYDGDVCGVEASTMRMVLADVRALAPAESRGIILWSHATGWIEDGIAENRGGECLVSPLSFGLSGRRKMNTSTLADVLEGEGLDFVYFDCCYMMGIESVYELRRTAPVLAGSPTELPSAGMPYERTLAHFFSPGSADVAGAARVTFEYYDSMSGSARTSTMSVVRTAGLEALASATRAIYEVSKAGMPVAPFVAQRYTATGIERCNYFDFAQYVRHLGAGHPALVAAFDAALSSTVVYEAATPYLWSSIALSDHCGLSTYILPTYADAADRGYSSLEWWPDVASHLQ